jgi:ribonuclease D
LKQVL